MVKMATHATKIVQTEEENEQKLSSLERKILGLKSLLDTIHVGPETHTIRKYAEYSNVEEWQNKVKKVKNAVLELRGKDYDLARVEKDFPHQEAVFDHKGSKVFAYNWNRWGTALAIETLGKKPVGLSNKERIYQKLRLEGNTRSEAAFEIAQQTSQEGLILQKTEPVYKLENTEDGLLINLGELPSDEVAKTFVGSKVVVLNPKDSPRISETKTGSHLIDLRDISDEAVKLPEGKFLVPGETVKIVGKISEVGKLGEDYAARVKFKGKIIPRVAKNFDGLEAYLDKALVKNLEPRTYFTTNASTIEKFVTHVKTGALRKESEAWLDSLKDWSEFNNLYGSVQVPQSALGPLIILTTLMDAKVNLKVSGLEKKIGKTMYANLEITNQKETVSLPEYFELYWRAFKKGQLENTPENQNALRQIYFDTDFIVDAYQSTAGKSSKKQNRAEDLRDLNKSLFCYNALTSELAEEFQKHYNILRARTAVKEIDGFDEEQAIKTGNSEILPKLDVIGIMFKPKFYTNGNFARGFGFDYALIGARVLPDGTTQLAGESLPSSLDNFMYAMALQTRGDMDYQLYGALGKQ
jgi:hypothetical protein